MKNTDLDPIIALYRHADSRRIPDISTRSIVDAVKASRGQKDLLAEIRRAFTWKWAASAIAIACAMIVFMFILFRNYPSKESLIAIDISAKSVIITADNSVLEQKNQEQEFQFVYTSRNGKNVSVKL